MTLVSQIISDAYRESNITPLAGTPNDGQNAEGLTLLNRVVASSYGFEVGDKLQDFPIGNNNVVSPEGFTFEFPSDFYFPLNVRVVANLLAPTTYNLNPMPQDGSLFSFLKESGSDLTVVGNGRKINGSGSITLSDADSGKTFIYRADQGNWTLLSPLALTDQLPFPTAFDDYFVIKLALRLNPRYQTALPAESGVMLKEMDRKFKAQYTQRINIGSEPALVILPGTRWQRGYGYCYEGDPTQLFNVGNPFLY